MPEPGSSIHSWSNTRGGEYGRLGGRNAAPNMFTGRNVLVYSNGSIGPRPGLVNVTPTGMPVGKLNTLVSTPVVGRDGLFIIGNTVYRFDLGTPSVAPSVVGTFDTAPAGNLNPRLTTDIFYIAIPGDKCYRIDPTNDQVDPVTGVGTSPGGTDVILWNSQMVVVADGSDADHPTYRLFASEPGDVNDWGQGRFIDVGDSNWQITALAIQRNTLAVLKRHSANIITGVIGDEQTQDERTLATGDTTLHPWNAGIDADDIFHFVPVFFDSPGDFNGSRAEVEHRVHFDGHEHDDGDVLPRLQGLAVMQGLMSSSTIAMVRGGDTQQALINHNGAWTVHDFDVDVSGMCDANGTELLITDGGDTGTAANVWLADMSIDRPAFTSDVGASPGDGSTTPMPCEFTYVQYWDPSGREFEVRQIIVDFTAFNTGATGTNHFDVEVKILGRSDGAAPKTYSTVTDERPLPYDAVGSTATTDGVQLRKTFDFNCAPGSGVEVTIKNLRGVQIDDTTLMGPVRPWRPLGV